LIFSIVSTPTSIDTLRTNYKQEPSPSKFPFVTRPSPIFIARATDRKGYSDEEKRRAFALTFQLWRAYYFIVRTLVGRSSLMKKLRQRLWNNVFTHNIDFYLQYLWNRMEDFSTIIAGETGTGKGTAAMAIGRSGFIPFDEINSRFVESFAQSFVTLNLSQFPEALIESELFGHKKGAFTGAVDDHEGVLQRCSRYGAIFLDEIGEVSFPIQIKLLKVLEERLFSPVGSHEIHRFEGRIIAATNRDLDELVGKGVMRSDFYYRLCSDIITVVPLRDRIKDDPRELDDLLGVIVTKILGVNAPEAIDHLRGLIVEQLGLNYDWPGNVRELAQCVRRLLLNKRYEILPAAPRSLPSTWTRAISMPRRWSDAIAICFTAVSALLGKSPGERSWIDVP